jgi:hypothetical protein
MVDRAKHSILARRLAIRWTTLVWQAEIVVCLPTRHSPSDVLRLNDEFLFNHEKAFSLPQQPSLREGRQNVPLSVIQLAPQNCRRRRPQSRGFRSRSRKQ